MGARGGRTVVFQNWSGGEYGQLDPVLAGRAEKPMFTAKNLIRSRTGLMIPRPGLVDLGLTSAPTGSIQAMENCVQSSSISGTGPYFYVMAGGNIYRADIGAGSFGSAYTETDTLPTPSAPVPYGGSFGSGAYLNIRQVSSGTAGLYKADHATNTVTRESTDVKGDSISYYHPRFVASGSDSGTNSNFIYYSDVFPGWDTWPTANYYNVAALEISLIRPWRNGLLIGTVDGQLFRLTGVLGSGVTIRRISSGGAGGTAHRNEVMDDDTLWYFRKSVAFPTRYDGARHDQMKHLVLSSTYGDDGDAPGFGVYKVSWDTPESVAMLSGQGDNNALVRTGGVFTKHTFETDISAWAAQMDLLAYGTGDTVIQYLVIASDDGNGDFYRWQITSDWERPGFTSDQNSQPGDASTTPFTTCYLHTPIYTEPGASREMKVTEVIVDFVGWNTGSATDNRMDCSVVAYQEHDDFDTGRASTTQTWESATSNFSTSGSRGRKVFGVGDQGFGSGFQIKLDNIRGIGIDRITAVLSDDAAGTRRP